MAFSIYNASRICNMRLLLKVPGSFLQRVSGDCAKRSFISQLPEVPVRVPKQSFFTSSCAYAVTQHADHNHSRLWTAERALSAGLLGILPAAFIYPNTALDYVAALALVVHIHWGIEAIAVDYIRPSIVGATIARAAVAGVYFLSVMTLGGLFYFNYNDVGLMQAIRMLWKL